MVMVGGSHSSRLTDELDDTCLEVMDISIRGWRLSEAAVEEKARELSEIVSSTDESRTTIVYQLFDNSSYFVKRQDGSRSLPGRGGDGRYHVDGKLEIATREETKRLVSTSIPLLRAGGKCRKVILTPSGRYRYSPCCNVRGHCSNMKDSNYGRWMEEKMDYVRMRNIKRATVMEFGQLITPAAGQSSYLHEEEIWGEDPIHYTSKGYNLAAAGLESLVYEKRSEEREAGPSGGQGPSKKAKLDLTLKRPDWVKGSVAEAVQRDTGGHTRPPFQQGKWRGQLHDSYRGSSSRGRGSDRGRGADRGCGSDRGRGCGTYPGGRGWPSRGHYYKKW